LINVNHIEFRAYIMKLSHVKITLAVVTFVAPLFLAAQFASAQ